MDEWGSERIFSSRKNENELGKWKFTREFVSGMWFSVIFSFLRSILDSDEPIQLVHTVLERSEMLSIAVEEKIKLEHSSLWEIHRMGKFPLLFLAFLTRLTSTSQLVPRVCLCGFEEKLKFRSHSTSSSWDFLNICKMWEFEIENLQFAHSKHSR